MQFSFPGPNLPQKSTRSGAGKLTATIPGPLPFAARMRRAGHCKPSRAPYGVCPPGNTGLRPGAMRIGQNSIPAIANLTT